MPATAIQPSISNNLGELSVTDDSWNVTFTKEGSGAISSMDWNGKYLDIVFRHKGNLSDPYTYSVRNSADSVLLQEAEAVLNGETVVSNDGSDVPASVGSVYNQLLKASDLILVD